MNRTEFIIVTAIILFVAFLLGWFAHWLIHRFTRVARSDVLCVMRFAHDVGSGSSSVRIGLVCARVVKSRSPPP